MNLLKKWSRVSRLLFNRLKCQIGNGGKLETIKEQYILNNKYYQKMQAKKQQIVQKRSQIMVCSVGLFVIGFVQKYYGKLIVDSLKEKQKQYQRNKEQKDQFKKKQLVQELLDILTNDQSKREGSIYLEKVFRRSDL